MTKPDFQARHCIDFACFTQTLLKPNFMRILPSNVVPNLHLEYLEEISKVQNPAKCICEPNGLNLEYNRYFLYYLFDVTRVLLACHDMQKHIKPCCALFFFLNVSKHKLFIC